MSRPLHSDLRTRSLTALAGATAIDDIDRVTLAAMRERLSLAEQTYAAGLDEMSLNVLASPLQSIRDVFDLMPRETDAQRVTFAARMTKVPAALDSYVESLRDAASRGAGDPQETGRGLHRPVRAADSPGRLFRCIAQLKLGRCHRPRSGGRRHRRHAQRCWRGFIGLCADGRFPAQRATPPGTRGRCLRSRSIPAPVAVLPRGHGRPRGDLSSGVRRSSPALLPRWRRWPSRSRWAPTSRRP